MKRLRLCALCLTLAGCGQSPVEPAPSAELDDKDSVVTARSAAAEKSTEQVKATEQTESTSAPEEYYLPVADWLVQRRGACQQDREAIRAQLERYRQSFGNTAPTDEEAQVVRAYSQLKALMLASCSPARTPGLLNSFLREMESYEHWPPEYTALFDLLRSEYEAYSLLEDKYRQLEHRHRKTIDGIGNIEQSLENGREQ